MLTVGQKYTCDFCFSQNDVDDFIRISGDNNPIHHSEEYSRNTIFKKPIIHGFLSASIFSKILGMHLPGEGTIYLSQNLKFVSPMYVGETYQGIVEIKNVSSAKSICTISTKVTDPEGSATIIGEAIVQNKSKIH